MGSETFVKQMNRSKEKVKRKINLAGIDLVSAGSNYCPFRDWFADGLLIQYGFLSCCIAGRPKLSLSSDN